MNLLSSLSFVENSFVQKNDNRQNLIKYRFNSPLSPTSCSLSFNMEFNGNLKLLVAHKHRQREFQRAQNVLM